MWNSSLEVVFTIDVTLLVLLCISKQCVSGCLCVCVCISVFSPTGSKLAKSVYAVYTVLCFGSVKRRSGWATVKLMVEWRAWPSLSAWMRLKCCLHRPLLHRRMRWGRMKYGAEMEEIQSIRKVIFKRCEKEWISGMGTVLAIVLVRLLRESNPGKSVVRKQDAPTLNDWRRTRKYFHPVSQLWLEGGLLWLRAGDKWELERGTVAAWASLICGLTMPRESDWRVWTGRSLPPECPSSAGHSLLSTCSSERPR